MTDDAAVWRAVGELLLVLRTRRGWNAIDIDRAGGPNYSTVQEQERGLIRSTASLHKHATALGVSVEDVLREVLGGQEQWTAEEARLVRKYRTTTVEGRSALVAMAQALPDTHEPPTPPPSAGAPRALEIEPRATATASKGPHQPAARPTAPKGPHQPTARRARTRRK
ncbi:MAG: hypothetical protein AB7H88_21585 [Vicinamibacterales bacterium]